MTTARAIDAATVLDDNRVDPYADLGVLPPDDEDLTQEPPC